MRRRIVGVEIAGPLRLGGLDCRRCGGQSVLWRIVGVSKGDIPRFWECMECGLGEVVTGTPMNFVRPMGVGQAGYDLEVNELLSRWEAYRRGAGLVPYGQFAEKKLTTDKYSE